MKYNKQGEELPDDTPLEAPVKFRRAPSIQELIAMHVRAATQVERKMGVDDDEDFDDSEDADDVLTPYEIDAYAGEAGAEIKKAEATQKVLDRLKEARNNKTSNGGSDGFSKDKERVGRVGQSGSEVAESDQSGRKDVSSGKESKGGAVDGK